MVKYRSKGNLPQKADYYALLNRSDADWRDSVRQGLCASFNGINSECSLANAIDLTGNWSMEISFAPAVVDVLQYFVSEVVTSPTRRFYVSLENGKVLLHIGTGERVVISNALSVGASYTLYMSYSSTTGIITSKLRTRSTGALTDLTDYTVAGLDATNGTWRIGRAPTGGWYSGCIHELTIWKSTKTVAQMDSTKTDAELIIPFSGSAQVIKGNIVINSANITYGRSDYATFRSDEYGFAVKSGVIYPKLLDGSGYAGLVGDPDKIYYPGPYPNTFTGNWHELTHAYFDKSNTDIWEDFVRESINYISEEPTYWHVSELTQDFIDTYVKAAYADKIFVGLDATDSDYAGAVMVFESGITADQLKDLNFWRKRKYFPERA